MGINVIGHNLSAMNTRRSLNISTGNKAKSMERLSSGYRINRAADDAAGLAISEKMRRMVRGLTQGTLNTKDGVSWVKTGDGTLDEAHEILHRMTQLTVQSLNGTWTEVDRHLMQAEFTQLQSEIDRLTGTVTFNEKHIFSEHEIPYYQFEGNMEWLPNQKHVISEGSNSLSITYRLTEDSAPIQGSITVPPGLYTTKELVDEIDTALEKSGLRQQGLALEYTAKGTCNLNLEGGVRIDEAGGGLAYLLYDSYEGGSTGALIGTTFFPDDVSSLPIVTGKNDTMSFDIESLDGTTRHIKITIDEGDYSRPKLIELLNEELKDTSVEAVAYGNGIKLTSDDSIITALKGNMFKVDKPGEEILTSVFYDNIGYDIVQAKAAELIGGSVLTSGDWDSADSWDKEHMVYHIDESNNTLIVQSNGMAAPITLTIDKGNHSIDGMVGILNQKFTNLGLVAFPNSDRRGITVRSTVLGVESDVGIDPLSSAYNTLFVTKAYNELEEAEESDHETMVDRNANYYSGKYYTDDDMPFVIVSGVNDKFVLNLDGSLHEITMSAKAYTSFDKILDGIKDAVKKAAEKLPDDSKEKEALSSVSIYDSSNRIMITNSLSTRIQVQAYTDASGKVNAGYNDIFATNASYNGTVSETNAQGWEVLNTPITELPVEITSNLFIHMEGESEPCEVRITPKVYNTYQEIIDELKDKLPRETTTYIPIGFTYVNESGTSNVIDMDSKGSTIYPSDKSYNASGSASNNQGEVGSSRNDTAASVKIGPISSGPYTITDENNKLSIEVNSKRKELTLKNGSYKNTEELAAMLQKILDAEFRDDKDVPGYGVEVGYTYNTLTLTARLENKDTGERIRGNRTNISCSTETSNFLYEIHTIRSAASISINSAMNESINITSGVNDTFNFTYTENGTDIPVSLTLSQAEYTPESLGEEITNQLKAEGLEGKVKAQVGYRWGYGYNLMLSAVVPGEGYKLSFDSSGGNGGTALKAIFKNADTEEKPAVAEIDTKIQQSFTIDNSSNAFNITINNRTYSLTLDKDSYNPSTFVDQLNKKLTAAGAGATASLSTDGKLVLTTDAVGNGAGISLNPDNCGSSMGKIFGTREYHRYGVKADFNSDHQLTLITIDKYGNVVPNKELKVYSNGGSIFQRPGKGTQVSVPGTAVEGWHSTKYAYIDGANLYVQPVTIDEWNSDLNFTYYDAGYPRPVYVNLDYRDYTYEELRAELQAKLDEALKGSENKLNVEVSKDGVRIVAPKPGSTYYMDNFRGGFYYNVLRHAPEQRVDTDVKIEKGGYKGDVYAVGRKDVRNNITEITKDINDTLSLDFSYATSEDFAGENEDKIHKISMSLELEPGNYDGNSLVKHIQDKLNEELMKQGLERNTIEVQIGGINTGVTGNNDANALVFKLSNTVKLPEENMEYRIDGIGGKAAFSVFYQTDGDMKIAYVSGTKDISKGVTIPESGDMSFDVDGQRYTLNIKGGKYSAEQIIDYVNSELKRVGAPVTAKIENGSLRLTHTKYGKHQITNISGSVQKYLFFQENGATQGEKDIWIQVGAEVKDGMYIERPTMNTVSLGINSITITKEQYAEKALERVKAAVTKVSQVRSKFGATQNRLEHAINQNENTIENTQKSESLIRDTDMAKEIIRLAKYNILENAGVAMLAQANRSKDNILTLLQ